MAFLDSKYKKKSMAITITIHVILLLLLIFVFGLKYMDPPIESGIAVNFGTSDTGSGNVQPTRPVRSAPRESRPEPVKATPEQAQEKVLSQEIEEAPVINKNDKREQQEVSDKQEKAKKPVEEVAKPDPKPDKATTDALSSLINAPKRDGKSKEGEGDDRIGGDKGDPSGDPNARAYYGVGKGLDGDGNYLLGGRRALNKEKYLQDCNEAGIVVVSIEVDQSGRVISAVPGVKGTTNNSRCLLDPAKRAAMATRFNSDPNAPGKQIGKIIYRFSLSE